MTPLIELPEFQWSGTAKKIELSSRQTHIIEAIFKLAEVMGGVSFHAAACRVLQLAPQVLEEEKRLNRNIPAQFYGSSPPIPHTNTPAHDPAPRPPAADVPAPAPRLDPPCLPSSVCAADLI